MKCTSREEFPDDVNIKVTIAFTIWCYGLASCAQDIDWRDGPTLLYIVTVTIVAATKRVTGKNDNMTFVSLTMLVSSVMMPIIRGVP